VAAQIILMERESEKKGSGGVRERERKVNGV
jgi:hypothetical protein